MAYGLRTPLIDGARKDITAGMLRTPLIDGVRKEPVACRKQIDGAWVDVWTALLPVTLSVTDEFYNNTISWFIGNGDSITILTTPSDGIACYIDIAGNFTNPVVSFGYDVDSDITSVGTVYSHYSTSLIIQAFTGDSMATSAHEALDGYTEAYSSTFSYTPQGTFDKIRIAITLDDSSNVCGLVNLVIKNILVDGKQYGTTDRIQA